MEGSIIIIQNSEGKYLVHKRGSTKKRFPNKYCIGAGGALEEGESKEDAAHRELYEEVGVKDQDLKFLFRVVYIDGLVMNIFLAKFEKVGKVCDREFSWHGWMTLEEIDKLLKNGDLADDTICYWEKYLKEYL